MRKVQFTDFALANTSRFYFSREKFQRNRGLLEFIHCLVIFIQIGSILPTASNQAMEVETSEIQTTSNLAFNLIHPALNTPPTGATPFNHPIFGLNASWAGNDMEMSDPEVKSFGYLFAQNVATEAQFPHSTGRSGQQRNVERGRTRSYNFKFGIPQGQYLNVLNLRFQSVLNCSPSTSGKCRVLLVQCYYSRRLKHLRKT